MASFGTNPTASAGFQVKPHGLVQLALKKNQQIIPCFWVHHNVLPTSEFLKHASWKFPAAYEETAL
jgi:hypothetical protein